MSEFKDAVTIHITVRDGRADVKPEIARVHEQGQVTFSVDADVADQVQIVFKAQENGADPFAHDANNKAHIKAGVFRCTGVTSFVVTCDKKPLKEEQDWVYNVVVNGKAIDPIIKVRGRLN